MHNVCCTPALMVVVVHAALAGADASSAEAAATSTAAAASLNAECACACCQGRQAAGLEFHAWRLVDVQHQPSGPLHLHAHHCSLEVLGEGFRGLQQLAI